MTRTRFWIPLLASAATVLACSEALTGPQLPQHDEARAATRGRATATQLSFQNLAPGDAVIVHVEAGGCYHHDTYEFSIDVRADGAIMLSGTRTSHLPMWAEDTPGTISFGKRTLTATQISGLDRMLAYYRSDPPSSCTSSHTISLRHMRDGAPLHEESYKDGSCAMEEAKEPWAALSLSYR